MTDHTRALETAVKIVEYGLHLRMYGERAPGGDETWAEFDRRAEDFLRRRGCAARGFHTPDEPACPDCFATEPAKSSAPCGHSCCSDMDPLHDHFLRPADCPRCAHAPVPAGSARPDTNPKGAEK